MLEQIHRFRDVPIIILTVHDDELDKVRGIDELDYLKVFIYRLRHKIEPDPAHPRYPFTERSTGYWLATEG